MGWLVQHLLKNREVIRAKNDFDSDEFNDLIVIEKKIDDLYSNGLLSDSELNIIRMVSYGIPPNSSSANIRKNRKTISTAFSKACDRISYFLGGYFTDDGLLENMKLSYNLTDEDIDKLRLYINGKFKHTLMRNK